MSGVKVNNGVTNYGGMPSGGSGLLANRPAASVLGRIYIATDTLELYRDTGLVWTTIGGPGSGTVTGTGTVNEITFWNGAGSIGSLTTAVYPSLTELSYVKGVTSSIQTQINGKQDAIILTTSGTGGAATFIGNTLNVPQYQAALTNPVTGTGVSGQAAFWNGTNSIIGDNAFHWDNVNKRLGINTVNPGVCLDIHGTGIIQQLNGTTTNNAYLDFQNAGSTQWRIGNQYSGATNRFSIFNAAGGGEIVSILQGGNFLLNNSFSGADGMTIANIQNLSWTEGANNESYANIFRQRNSAATVIGNGVKRSNSADFASSFSSSTGRSAISVGGGDIHLFTNAASTVASGTNIVLSQRVTINNIGYVGIGYNVPAATLSVAGSALINTNTANSLYELFVNGNIYTGGLSPTISTQATSVAMTRTQCGYVCTTTLTLTLPAASGLNNFYFVVANTGATVTVQRAGTDTILDKLGVSQTSVIVAAGTRSMFYVGGGSITYQIF